MTNDTNFIKIIEFWKNTLDKGNLLNRDITKDINLKNKEVVDLIGVRRCGKSSVFKLIIKNLDLNQSLYLNFEDPFFIENNNAGIIEEFIEVYKTFFNKDLRYLFFDEIQNINNWEKAIRKLRDSGTYKIFLTDSSSKLLSKELSTSLTGRHITYTIFPLSFTEFLRFRNISINDKKDIALKDKTLINEFKNYLFLGGFPEAVLNKDGEILKNYFYDIIQKDIVMRYDIRQKDILERLGIYLISNSARLISFSSIQQMFNISFEMASNYLNYFKETFLILELPQFAYSLKKQEKAFKKIYCIDTGLTSLLSFKFSEDNGRMLEQAVFLELKRRGDNFYYYKTSKNEEIDFLIKEGNKIKELIQVCYDISDKDTKKREVNSLLNAMNELNLKEGLILTYEQEDEFKVDGRKIKVIPVWKWLLN